VSFVPYRITVVARVCDNTIVVYNDTTQTVRGEEFMDVKWMIQLDFSRQRESFFLDYEVLQMVTEWRVKACLTSSYGIGFQRAK
jgi:hypothetical protein